MPYSTMIGSGRGLRKAACIARYALGVVAVALYASFHMTIYTAAVQRRPASLATTKVAATPPSTTTRLAATTVTEAAARSAVRPTNRVLGRTVAVRAVVGRKTRSLRRKYTQSPPKAIGPTVGAFAFDALDYVPPLRTTRRPRLPAAVTNRSWAPDLYTCAFVTVMTTRARLSHYALLIESALRLGDAFKLTRRYPHLFFHEAALPSTHRVHVASHVPHAIFRSLTPVFRSPTWTPPEKAWQATDRTTGYKKMCRFYGLQIAHAMRDLKVDAFMRVDDDV